VSHGLAAARHFGSVARERDCRVYRHRRSESQTAHYTKLHKVLTDHSPLGVSLFTERAEAAKWLGVPPGALTLE
jgi:hypothetical protein